MRGGRVKCLSKLEAECDNDQCCTGGLQATHLSYGTAHSFVELHVDCILAINLAAAGRVRLLETPIFDLLESPLTDEKLTLRETRC
jgi:hypothetical protein